MGGEMDGWRDGWGETGRSQTKLYHQNCSNLFISKHSLLSFFFIKRGAQNVQQNKKLQKFMKSNRKFTKNYYLEKWAKINFPINKL
jgi:hypothetical protein